MTSAEYITTSQSRGRVQRFGRGFKEKVMEVFETPQFSDNRGSKVFLIFDVLCRYFNEVSHDLNFAKVNKDLLVTVNQMTCGILEDGFN